MMLRRHERERRGQHHLEKGVTRDRPESFPSCHSLVQMPSGHADLRRDHE